jgi:hypothetical protein
MVAIPFITPAIQTTHPPIHPHTHTMAATADLAAIGLTLQKQETSSRSAQSKPELPVLLELLTKITGAQGGRIGAGGLISLTWPE